MNLTKTILLILIVTGFSGIVSSQNKTNNHKIEIEIPEVALLGLVSDNSAIFNINPIAPDEAGNSINFSGSSQNREIWINYSSVNRDNNHQRKVVAIVQGELPTGFHLFVEASDAGGLGKGKLGQTTGIVALSKQETDVITGIGSSYTGKGINNGHLLSYKIEMDESTNYLALSSHEQNSINVIYTLTDQN